MSVVAKLGQICRLPPDERRRRIRNRLRNFVSFTLFGLFRSFFNRPGSPFVLMARPDFDFYWQEFPEYSRLSKAWSAGMPHNGADIARLYLLWLNVRQMHLEDVQGDVVELGVYKGNSAKVLRDIMGDARHLFLFDTFSGFDGRDLNGVDAKVKLDSFGETSLDAVRAFVGNNRVTYVAGFFPDSANNVELPRSIALAHIDCDLYEPMKAALTLFYPRMSPGGMIVMHDYASGHWAGATRAIDEFFADKPESVVIMPDKSGTAIARKVAINAL